MLKVLAQKLAEILIPLLVDEIKQLFNQKHKNDAKESNTGSGESSQANRDTDSLAGSTESSLGNV